MKKYKNRQFHYSVIDVIMIFALIAASVFIVFCLKEYNSTAEKYNIGKTNVTHIIQTPSNEQVKELSSMDHISAIVPYYFSSVDTKIDGKKVKIDVYLVDNFDSLENTLFSNQLLIKSADSLTKNSICIDSYLAQKYNLSVGDKIEIVGLSEGVACEIYAVFKNDGRHDTGMMMTQYSGEIKSKIDPDGMLKYSGAYICSSDEYKTDLMLQEYVPLGDLRGRDDFQTDELYQAYLDLRNTTDYTQTNFYRSSYLQEVAKRYDSTLLRNKITIITTLAIMFLVLFMCSYCRTSKYIKNDFLKDLRNNYTVEQEREMFVAYYLTSTEIAVVVSIAIVLISKLVFKVEMGVLSMGAIIVVPMVALVISEVISLNKIKKLYLDFKAKEELKKKQQ